MDLFKYHKESQVIDYPFNSRMIAVFNSYRFQSIFLFVFSLFPRSYIPDH